MGSAAGEPQIQVPEQVEDVDCAVAGEVGGVGVGGEPGVEVAEQVEDVDRAVVGEVGGAGVDSEGDGLGVGVEGVGVPGDERDVVEAAGAEGLELAVRVAACADGEAACGAIECGGVCLDGGSRAVEDAEDGVSGRGGRRGGLDGDELVVEVAAGEASGGEVEVTGERERQAGVPAGEQRGGRGINETEDGDVAIFGEAAVGVDVEGGFGGVVTGVDARGRGVAVDEGIDGDVDVVLRGGDGGREERGEDGSDGRTHDWSLM